MDQQIQKWNRRWLTLAIVLPAVILGFQQAVFSFSSSIQITTFKCQGNNLSCNPAFYFCASIIGIIPPLCQLFIRPKASRFSLLGFSLALLFFAKLINLLNIPATLALAFFFVSWSNFVSRFSLLCIVVETFASQNHAWYIILNYFSASTGEVIGFTFAKLVKYSLYPPFVSLLLLSTPTLLFSLFLSLFYFSLKLQTPVCLLQFQNLAQAQYLLDQLYPSTFSKRVLSGLQREIDCGVYSRGRCFGLCPKRWKSFLFLIVFFFVAECNGNLFLRTYPSSVDPEDSSVVEWFQFSLHLLKFFCALSALLVMWQVSHKILLICGSLVMAQCWMIIFVLMGRSTSLQLIIINFLLMVVYRFVHVWAFRSLMYVLAVEVESLFGMIWLIGFGFFLSNAKYIFQLYDPIYRTEAEALVFFAINIASCVFFIFHYKETRNRRKEELVENIEAMQTLSRAIHLKQTPAKE